VDPGKIIVIYNGLDPDRFTRLRDGSVKSELGLGAGPVVTVVCNFIAYKGHRYFFEAWREVVKEHPDAVALLIGEGPTRRGWEQWCLDAGIDATVRFLGSRGDVPRILSSADLFVHPSLEEGYSNAVLEAMASSLPVIVTAVGGNVEAVQHEVTGLLVPARDPAALASAMIRLLGDAAARERLGSAARFRVEQEFHIARMIEAYQRVYDRLIESLHSGTEKQHVWDSRPV
jgi:glycosyltransferase involved in cell wall biosynthesis